MADKLILFSDILEWQIDRRWQNQKIMHKLHRFMEEHKELPREHNDQWYPIIRMVGIAFSLWRAAFLTDNSGKKTVVYDHTKEFLDKVLKHNSITFADDHRMCDLTLPYYTSNARYRLERMYYFNPELLQIPTIACIEQLAVDQREEMKQDELWDMCYVALVDCFEDYMKHWQTHVRPQKFSFSKNKRKKSKSKASVDGSSVRRPTSRRQQ